MQKNELVDTHCHLYLEEYAADLPEVMLRAEQEGVIRFFMPSLDSNHLEAMLKVENDYPGRSSSMAGIHPCYIKENYLEELKIVEDWLAKRRFAALGEIGLDYYWDRTFEAQQKTAFREQILMAKAYALPVVIHSRSSMDDCIGILRAEKDLTGIFHCFSGTVENAMDIIGCGLLLGIGGVVTYKNAGLAEVVAALPLEHMVLETDAPFLTPVPFRGKRNESSYLKYVVKKIAELKGIPESEVAAVTTANAKKVFGQQ